ncbi:hypothetical protein ACWE42_15565 [Sutcliffiella cohnii]
MVTEEQVLTDVETVIFEDYRVRKQYFVDFRNVLIKADDFQSFRGKAQVGGDCIYTFKPRGTK